MSKTKQGFHRIVYDTNSVQYSNLLNRANLPSLQNRRLQDLAALVYKVKYGLVPSNVVFFLVLSHPFITKEIWIFIYSDLTVYFTGSIL